MDLQKKLQEAVDEYQAVVKQVQDMEQTKNTLIQKGVKLEGRITLLQEQIAEQTATPA